MIDVFIDLTEHTIPGSALRSLVEKWAQPESLGAIAGHVTCVLPARGANASFLSQPGWSFIESESLPALSERLAATGREGVPLLLLLGPVDVNGDAIGVMRQRLDDDPMFGFAVPRVCCVDRCCFVRLPRHGVGISELLPRKILADLPDAELLVETVAPCMLIGPQILGNFGPLNRKFEKVTAALLHCMATARRCGFRAVLCNRAVVAIGGLTCDAPSVRSLPALSPPDVALLQELVPDLERTWQDFRAGSWERFEQLCTSRHDGPTAAPRPSLLLDVRNVGPIYSGTTQAVLGLVNAIRELKPKWDIEMLAQPHGAAFHDLARIYSSWTIHTAVPNRPFTVALRPSQPWHIHEMVQLHYVSLLNAYMVLDTIAWDIGYSALNLEGTWQFMAEHADAFLFDSEFTRQRFLERFPAGCSVPGLVTHLSFDPTDYVRSDVARGPAKEFIFVVGNNLDHKDVLQTVEALASAFPFRHIKALGPASIVSPFVTAHQSGGLSELDLHKLYANAQYVVFPSFYEGFGFPILTALAYGRTVLARRSALLEEVAARCAPGGRLVTFERREELVGLVGQLVHGNPVPEYPLGRDLTNGRPKAWRDIAQDTLDFLESLARAPARGRWIARERVVQQLLSYRN